MLRAIAALTLASATAPHSSATLLPTAPWWERITVTISGDGKPQSCKVESSLKPASPQTCDVTGDEASQTQATTSSGGAKAEYTKITFERRFKPGSQPDRLFCVFSASIRASPRWRLGLVSPRHRATNCSMGWNFVSSPAGSATAFSSNVPKLG